MAAFAAVFQAGSMSQVSDLEAEIFMNEFEKLIDGIDALGIFLHNTTIALPMFIPGIGVAWGLVSAWSTGFAFAAISVSMSGIDGATLPAPLAILFLTPFGLMEIIAYSLAMSRSLLLFVAIIRRQQQQRLSTHLPPTLIEICIVVSLLLAGGYVELFLIEQLM